MYVPHNILEHNLTFTAKNVEEFMAYYWEEFPNATVTPKLHILEDHKVPWLQKCKVRFGLLDEQRAESILNTFESIYRTMPDKVEWLKQLMKEHYLHIAPENIAQGLLLKKRS